MTRTEEALRQLERAKREDAKDASLRSCKLCGSPARRFVGGGSESTRSDYAEVYCSNRTCGNMVKIDPPYDSPLTISGIQAMETEAMRRWNILNS